MKFACVLETAIGFAGHGAQDDVVQFGIDRCLLRRRLELPHRHFAGEHLVEHHAE